MPDDDSQKCTENGNFRTPGPLTWRWDGGRGAVLDGDQRIVGYMPSMPRSEFLVKAEALAEAAAAWSPVGVMLYANTAAWLRERAFRILAEGEL